MNSFYILHYTFYILLRCKIFSLLHKLYPDLTVEDDVVPDADVDDVLGHHHELGRGVHREVVPGTVLEIDTRLGKLHRQCYTTVKTKQFLKHIY